MLRNVGSKESVLFDISCVVIFFQDAGVNFSYDFFSCNVVYSSPNSLSLSPLSLSGGGGERESQAKKRMVVTANTDDRERRGNYDGIQIH